MDTQPDGRREAPREGVLKGAKIVIGDAVMNCLVLDVSAKGARVRLDAAMVLPARVSLCFRGGAAFVAEPRWARAQEVGLAFVGPAAMTQKTAAQVAALLQAMRDSGADKVLATLREFRAFDDPALAALSHAAREAWNGLAAALEARARADAPRAPDVYDA